MSDTTTITPIAAFNPANRFVTFEGLKDYDANLISNLHSLGYNNKVSGANIFAWGNNNQIDGQNLFVFGNEFNLTSIAKRPSMFIGNGSIISKSGWNDTENTIFGVWHEYSPAPIFRVGAEETASNQDWLSAAFSIGRDGSFYAANGKFIVNANGSFSAVEGLFRVDGRYLNYNELFQVDSQDGLLTAEIGDFKELRIRNGTFSVNPEGNLQANQGSFSELTIQKKVEIEESIKITDNLIEFHPQVRASFLRREAPRAQHMYILKNGECHFNILCTVDTHVLKWDSATNMFNCPAGLVIIRIASDANDILEYLFWARPGKPALYIGGNSFNNENQELTEALTPAMKFTEPFLKASATQATVSLISVLSIEAEE